MKDLFGNPMPNLSAAQNKKRTFPDWCQANQLPLVLSEDQMRYLSNRDLFAYILRDPNKAEKLTCAYDNVAEIALATLSDLQQAGDLTEREAQILNIAFELGRRLLASEQEDRVKIDSPESAYKVIASHFIGVQQEELIMVTLDTKNQVIRKHLVFRGSLSASVCSPHTVFRLALSDNCASILLAHNHPSGDPNPSAADIQCTQALLIAGKTLEITVIDHLIIGNGNYISLKDKGYM